MRRRSIVLPGTLLISLLFVTGNATGATFTVSNNADGGSGSLRQAVIEANTTAGRDEIVFDANLGTITLTSGQIEISDSLEIRGPEGRQTVSGNGCSRIFKATAGNLRFENLQLVNGIDSATCGSPSGDGSGGAVLIDFFGVVAGDDVAVFENCEVSGNRAERLRTEDYASGEFVVGGGISAIYGTLTIRNSSIRDNEVAGASTAPRSFAEGGGVSSFGGNMEVIDSIIESNRVSDDRGAGGGLAGMRVEVINSRVSGNVASGLDSRGGGIFGSDVRVRNSYVASNSVDVGSFGGGIAANILDLAGSTLHRNQANGGDGGGGAIYVFSRADLVNSTIFANLVDDGSVGSVIFSPTQESINIINSTVYGNGPNGQVISLPTADLNLTSSILAGNGPPNFLFASIGTLNSRNSIFGGFESTVNGVNIDNIFINDPQMNGFTDWGCSVPAPEDCVPMLAPFGAGAAINAGANPRGLASDQRGVGFPRVFGVQADIGAFEADVPDLGFEPNPVSFGSLSVGDSAVLSVTATNIGSQGLEIVDTGASGPFDVVLDECRDVMLSPGDECQLEVRFTPEANGEVDYPLSLAWITELAPAPVQAVASLEGRGTEPLVALNPMQLDFGDLRVGTSAPAREVVVENSGLEPLEIAQVSLTGNHQSAFTVASDGCSNQTIAPAASCQVDVSSSPGETGARQALLEIPSNARSTPDVVDLRVNSVEPILEFSADPLDIGPVFINEGALASLTLRNSGSQALEISDFSPPSEPFIIEANECAPLPLVLNPGETCSIDFRMEPVDSLGVVSSSLTFESNADSSPDTLTISASIRPLIIPTMSILGSAFLIVIMLMISRRRLY